MSRIEENRASVADGTDRIAVLIACFNEAVTIARVVSDFREQLPNAAIYVVDNNSSDDTASEARGAGATVLSERRQGKGFVIQTMFRTIDADYFVMVDGDGTYPAQSVHQLLHPVISGDADMVIGSRLHTQSQSEFRHINRLGNRLVRGVLNFIFRVRLTDILSGYRAFNRRFVKALPLFGGGFEIETELTIKAVERGYRILEVPVNLTSRPEGSHSKIHFLRDSFLILNTTLALFRDYKPLTFFGSVGLFFFLLAVIPALISFVEWFSAGNLRSISWPIMALALTLCGVLSVTVGLILHSIARRSQEFEYQMQMLREELRSQNVSSLKSR